VIRRDDRDVLRSAGRENGLNIDGETINLHYHGPSSCGG
jgi:hypothetical protein